MKKLFTLIIACTFAVFTFAQVIPNFEFENWTSGKPTSWDGTNIDMGFGISVTTITQETTNPHSGTKSVKLETKSLLGNTVPGLITLGTFIAGPPSSVQGGIPFPHRPSKLKGYYRAEPSGSDQGFIGIGLSIMVGGVRDTIGKAAGFYPSAVTTWTPFEIDIDWTSTDTPDSLNILISCSDLVNTTVNTVGSKFWADSIYFEFGTTVDIHGQTQIPFNVSNCYPNPADASSNINFTSPEAKVYDFRIINLIGVEVFKTQIEAHKGINFYNFSTAELPSGIYMVNIKNTMHNQTKSLIINR